MAAAGWISNLTLPRPSDAAETLMELAGALWRLGANHGIGRLYPEASL